MAAHFALSVKGDVKAVLRDLDTVRRRIVPAAAAPALNKAATSVRVRAARGIASRNDIRPARLIRERLRVFKATRMFLVSTIRARLHPVKVIELSGQPRKTGQGLRKGRSLFRGAFLAYANNRKFGVYKRLTKKRFPIRELKIPLLPEADTVIKQLIRTVGAATWKKEFARQLKRKLARSRG